MCHRRRLIEGRRRTSVLLSVDFRLNDVFVCWFAGLHGPAAGQGEAAEELRFREEMGHHL